MVIDGYTYEKGEFLIHINRGENGKNDDWYNFFGAIKEFDDNQFRRIMTIKPE